MQLKGMYTEEWINTILNGSGEGIIITDENFKIKNINAIGQSITGWTIGEVLDKNLREVFRVVNEARLDVLDGFLNKLDKINEVRSTTFLINRNNHELIIEKRIIRIKDFSNVITGYVVFFKDISEEKLRSTEIRESEKKYRALFENAMEGIFILDEESRIIDTNPAACQIYRLKKEDLLRLTVKDIFPHKTHEESALIWLDFLHEGYLEGFYKYKLGNGDDKYIDFRAKTNFIPGLHLAVFSDVTEKTKTEKALRNSETNLKAIFNNTKQQLILVDAEYRILTFNKPAQESASNNIGRELSIGTSIFEYGEGETSREQFLPIYERVKNGDNIFVEINPPYFKTPDHWIEVGITPVFDHKKNFKAYLISSTDITFRKRAEISLAESEARFRSLVQNSSDIITLLDSNYIIKYTSSSIVKILGYNEADVVGKSILDFIYDEDKVLIKNVINKIIAGQDHNPVLEYRFLHAEGYYLYLETTCNNLLKDEHIQGIVLNTRDITERKYQEENLLLLERAIDSSGNGIIISDPNQPDNPIIYANKAFEQITGYSYLDIIGKNCRYLQNNDSQQQEIDKIRLAIKEQKEVSVVIRNYRKDGSLFWNELTISPVFNREGQITNYIGVINDITERKIAENTLLEITQGISGPESNIYESLVKHIGLTLKVDFVFIGEYFNDHVKTKALWGDGILRENIQYELRNTPCESILEKGSCFWYDHVAQEFPENKLLAAEKIFAYMGIPFKNSEGKPIGILSLMSRKPFENIQVAESILNIFSVRVAAEFERDHYLDALMSSEKKFKDLAKNSPDVIYIVDLGIHKVIYFNRTEIFGYDTSELMMSEEWSKIVHPDDVEKVIHHWNKFLNSTNNLTHSVEHRIKNKLGVYEWVVNRHIIMERTSEGKPRLVLLNITIITERKNAEEALKENQARLTALVENTSDIMWSVDKKLYFTTMNSAFKNLFNFHYHQRINIGDNLSEVLPSDLKDEWLGLHHRALSGERFSVEFNIENKGKVLSYEISYNPIYSTEGKVSGVSVFGRDITQRKMAENDIIRTNFELDSFVYRASHDLRAPLRSVLGLVNLAKTENEEAERNNYLYLVEKSVNKLDSFISDLTNFSRNSRLEVSVNKIDFRSSIQECIENLKYMDNADRIKTIIQVDDAIDFYSDPTRISIILHNLISNAIKYQNPRSEESYVEIDIATNQECALIKVKDNGKGIREEYLEKIFQMFFRASQESYGSGLGLYITKQVVEKLQGSVSVTSKIGSGSEFIIKLPNLTK
ncbi:MAG: PAS domain S-box protein [Cytophagaceae bacterium]|nr:PAS domain S-box protein [Cytophagaceae bacterium]